MKTGGKTLPSAQQRKVLQLQLQKKLGKVSRDAGKKKKGKTSKKKKRK